MSWIELLSEPDTYVSLVALSAMEIVLGIDNIVFITIVTARLPGHQQRAARRLGIGLALVSRLGLLFAISWIMGLTRTWFELLEHEFSGRDMILLGGGLFLVAKAAHEIFHAVEHPEAGAVDTEPHAPGASAGMFAQIILLDIVFSLDSVITAVGMVEHVAIMAVAMVLAVLVMLVFAGAIGDFVQRHASVRVLALSFLVLIGVLLLAEGLGEHLPKGYVYFAMAFSLGVELVNMRMRRRRESLRAQVARHAGH